VPKSIGQNRHLVAMGMFEGSELSRINAMPQPATTLRRILLKLRLLFCDARLVHGDLSEYNILMAESGQFVFIDWPQSVATSDPGANELLTRDVSNLVKFFARRHSVFVPVQEALDFVKAKKRKLGRIQTRKPHA
jgi:RIO kinase 2